MPTLRDGRVKADDLFFDPNNLRYYALDVEVDIPEDKVKDAATQRRARDRILEDQFEVDQIRKSIRTEGYSGVDRLIAVGLPPDDQTYVVIEGNRRLAAIKTTIEQADGRFVLFPVLRGRAGFPQLFNQL